MKNPLTQHRSLLLLAALVAIVPWSSPAKGQEAGAATGQSLEAHIGRGYDALKQDQYDIAAAEFQAALALDPSQALRARFPLAVALFEMHKSSDARRELETVRAEAGDHPNISYYLGRLDLEVNNFASAVRDFGKAAAEPPFPDTAYYLGFAYLKQGNLPSAEKWLKQAAIATPRDSRVPYQLGLVYRQLGRNAESQKAMALSTELRQRDNHESSLRQECARKLQQGNREEARAVCDQLYDPDNADKLTELGTLYGQHGDAEAALKPLRRAAVLQPHSPQTQYNLAMAYYQLGRFEQARAPLAGALKRWPDLFQLNALYGAVLIRLGDDSGSYQALHHAHQLNAQDEGTTNTLYALTLGLGKKSQGAQQFPEALRFFEEAAKLHPDDPEPHRRMAQLYAATGRTPEQNSEQQEAERLANNIGKPH